jgi:hypothetical protein
MAEASKDVVQRLTLVCRHAGRPTVVDDRGNTCACCDATEEIERLRAYLAQIARERDEYKASFQALMKDQPKLEMIPRRDADAAVERLRAALERIAGMEYGLTHAMDFASCRSIAAQALSAVPAAARSTTDALSNERVSTATAGTVSETLPSPNTGEPK